MLAALAVVGGFAVYRQSRTAAQLRLQNQRYLPVSVLLNRLYNNQDTLDVQLERLSTTRDPTARTWLQSARRVRRAVVARARSQLGLARHDAISPADQGLIAQLLQELSTVDVSFRESEAQYQTLYDALALGDHQQAQHTYRTLALAEQSSLATLREAARVIEVRMAALADDAVAEQRQTLRVLAAATTIALGFGLVMLISARNALLPLSQLIARVRAVASGDLRVQLVRAREDEIGELAGEFDKMVTSVRDRDTELRANAERIRAAERHLEQVVATLRAAVIVVNHERVIETANPATDTLAAGVSVRGMRFDDSPFSALVTVRALIESVLAGGSAAEASSVRFGDCSLDVAVAPFALPGRSAPGVLLVLDDVTSREQARADVLKSERLAAIGRMAAHVTHEVRNPLTSLALNAEMLQDELVENRTDGSSGKMTGALRLLSAMQREVDHLTAITEEYLRVARLPAPRLEREELGALVRAVADFVRPELSRANVELELRIEPAFVAVDEGQIRQGLVNLLRNAREAIGSVRDVGGKILIEVALRGARAELVVQDNGPGIDPAIRDRLFELFATTKEKGTGLGLSLTREIFLAHGGGVQVCDALGSDGSAVSGARFVLWLPSLEQAPHADPTVDRTGPASTSGEMS
jgi:nitrogen fixation/metabolism regulation signal transduction histidine kinase